MTNYAGQCGYVLPPQLQELRKTSWGRLRATQLRTYLDAKKRPYIYLLDGGLSDNIGMREVLENTSFYGDIESTFVSLGAKQIRKLVYLMVSAETSPDPDQYILNEIPGLMRVSRALIDIPINRYSTDTVEFMKQSVEQWRAQLLQRPQGVESAFTSNADIYIINVSFTEMEDLQEQARLMNIPTNLALNGEQVDHLLQAGAQLLRNDKEFQRLMRDLAEEAAVRPSP